MKNRRYIFFVVIALICVVLLLFLFDKRSPKRIELDYSKVNPELSESPAYTNRNQFNSAKGNLGTSSQTQTNLSISQPESKEAKKREALSKLNDVDIVYYGKVQDQFGNPLGETEIDFSVHFNNGLSAGVKNGKTVSDVSGLFTISGYKGERMSVIPKKEGYVMIRTNGGAIYSHFFPEEQYHPDSNNPTVITMWKLQGAEPLIHFQFKTSVPHDDTPVRFDLQTGKVVNRGGDLIIRVSSPSIPHPSEAYPWQATVQSETGGLILVEGIGLENMYSAPESGYESEFTIVKQKEVKPWSSRFVGGFYLKSGNRFCKINLKIITDVAKDGSISVTLSGYLNPSGSRNLEIDKSVVTEAK